MMPCSVAIEGFNPDASAAPAFALRMDFANHQIEVPRHRHCKGQLTLALHGAVTCVADGGMWIVPPHCAVWVPGGIVHSNRANARLALLFVEPGMAALPDNCCTLSISPMLRKMVDHLAGISGDYDPPGHTARLVRVLLDELSTMHEERLNLPISDHPKIQHIANRLTLNPSDRTTLPEWADRLVLSERSLTRLMVQETGLTFGRWRQQLQLIIALRELAAGAAVQ